MRIGGHPLQMLVSRSSVCHGVPSRPIAFSSDRICPSLRSFPQRASSSIQCTATYASSPALSVTSSRLGRTVTRRTTVVSQASPAASSAATNVADGSVSVVLLAGGVGKRMGAAIPKQYLKLKGQHRHD